MALWVECQSLSRGLGFKSWHGQPGLCWVWIVSDQPHPWPVRDIILNLWKCRVYRDIVVSLRLETRGRLLASHNSLCL